MSDRAGTMASARRRRNPRSVAVSAEDQPQRQHQSRGAENYLRRRWLGAAAGGDRPRAGSGAKCWRSWEQPDLAGEFGAREWGADWRRAKLWPSVQRKNPQNDQ
ncbi:hypothetical protein LBMAG56_21370 [Verrucomicrobiota bacterium]|nr:hypothetical protein LBMAG56_21370 [Verrucomicrobiota bacterium]